ncbi:hypothetical protein [Actinoplanes flavus]|uniref:Uncharacterized protein n=1 Tax=Actinoplanes flavus TaxID=2820290 RepID=A0ABS3UQ67_9ACTN|nr:hypothetical protein [Actinoplanes flavus]MBO3740924.1 hypothetical protein [Actinoplanes flavus]
MSGATATANLQTSNEDAPRIAVASAHVLVGCQLRREADDLLDQAQRTAPSLEPALEAIAVPGSPAAARVIAEHRPVCARQLDEDGTPDPTAVNTAEQTWTATGLPR